MEQIILSENILNEIPHSDMKFRRENYQRTITSLEQIERMIEKIKYDVSILLRDLNTVVELTNTTRANNELYMEKDRVSYYNLRNARR